MNLYRACGIYAIRNIKNGLCYIGKTSVSFGDRRDCHYALLRNGHHHNLSLQNDWDLMGEESFEFAILEECNDERLAELETKYIVSYKETGCCYNITDGNGQLGCHLSDSAKQKIGEKNRINMTGRKASGETRQKMSESRKGRKLSDEQIAALKRANTGRKATEETRAKLRAVNQTKSAIVTPEQVREIRRLHEEGKTYAELAKQYGFSNPNSVGMIVRRERWANVD